MSQVNNNTNQIAPLFSVALLQEYDDAGILSVPIPLGSKGPNKKGWNKRENCGISLAADALGWDENLGIAHAYSRTMALDIDDLKQAREWFAERGIDLDELLEAADAVLISSGRENRAKLLYQLPDGVDPLPSKKVKHDGFDIIDFRCATVAGLTVQDVLPPSIHPDTGNSYRWSGAGDFRDLPELPEELLILWQGLLNGAGKRSGKDSSLFVDGAKSTGTVSPSGFDVTTKGLMGGAYSGPPASPEKVKSALAHVTPDTGYDPWCAILRGLHDWDAGEAGRETGREWSAKVCDYCGDAEFDRKWDSFNEENIPEGAKTTIGTVFARATASGWPGWGVTSGYTEGSGSSTDELNKQFAFVLLDGRDYVLDVKRYAFSPIASIRNLLLNKFAHDENGTPIGKKTSGKIVPLPAFEVWIKSPQRRTYREIVFDPGRRHRDDQFNLYRGMSVEPVAGNCELILEHIRRIWCREDAEAYEYVISWMARMVQKPWLPAQSIITLHSEEGTGKGLITDILAEFFKHHHLIATHQRDITGRFNDKLGTSIFVCINEAVWGGNKADEGILKMLATDTTLTIEKKFVQKFSVPNCTHTLITSNNDWYAPLGRTDRRYLTLKVDNSIIGDYAYFDALRFEIDHGGREAFLDHLLKYDISTFEPRDIPKVNDEERARLKTENLNSIEKWIIDLVDGESLTAPSLSHESGLLPVIDSLEWETDPVEFPCRSLLNDYQSYAKARHYHIKSDTAVGLFLKKTLGVERVRLSTVLRPWAYILPKIADCRERITTMMGGSSPFSH